MNCDVVRWTGNQNKNFSRFKYRNCHQTCRTDTQNINRNITIMSNFFYINSFLFCKILIYLIGVIILNLSVSNFFDNVLAHKWVDTSNDNYNHYTHTWAVKVKDGCHNHANTVAEKHGFINRGKIMNDIFLMEHKNLTKRSINSSNYHQAILDKDERVLWSKQMRAKSRRKRDYITISSLTLNDAKWSQMWYLNRGNGLDMNVIQAWKEGITGKGVVVTILDDGLESTHPDLENNYDPEASYDVNNHDADPMPHYDITDSNRHGTRCAGEVAATANNTICAVGIAFGAKVGGVRMLDGDVTDAVEARSLSLNPQHIDIYSASWGPDDDGKTVDGPGELATQAFMDGITQGRNGKGSIFIWASGNGGRELDNCNCDGYTNSIWTLSISSATEEGHVPWYSEKCSSTLATTYSSGGQTERQVVTTDLHHSCTSSHTGTSASAPLAAGIVALVLEANRNLTWRDLQHIVVRTAKPANLKDSTWTKNGIGRYVSHSFGYGLMDAGAMVRLARKWQTVPNQQRCEIHAPHINKPIPPAGYLPLEVVVKHCQGVNFLEHVQARITLTSDRRGDIHIYLTSPAGTRVTLLTTRNHDNSRSGFNQWPFMSVHTWGEAPHGKWKLEIFNKGQYMGHAALKEWSLIFHGTVQPIYKNDPISVRPVTVPSLTSLVTLSQSTSTNYQIFNNHHYYSIPTIPKLTQKLNINKNGSRKQQQQQKQFLPYEIVIQTPKKNNKNSKNNNSSQANNKGNNKNNFGNKFGGTNRLNNSRNNFYRLLTNNKTNSNMKQSMFTTQRSKIYQQFSGSKISLENFYTNNNNKYEKIFKINEKNGNKAPKQIKINNFSSNTMTYNRQTTVMPNNKRPDNYARIQNQNSRIPKLFQQYDKIQQIFPEFYPYSGGTKSSKISSNRKQSEELLTNGNSKRITNTNSRNSNRSSDINYPKTITNTKPSRENTKKNSQILNMANVSKERVSISTNQKKSMGKLNEWNLMFYGTDQPAQHTDLKSHIGTYGIDIDMNTIDLESELAKNMQQIGENTLQSSKDITNKACLRFTDNQRCLECNEMTFLYKYNCYKTCPNGTYQLLQYENNEIGRPSVYDESEIENKFRRDTLNLKVTPEMCGKCHQLCAKCKGPLKIDCLTCYSGYQLIYLTDKESYCQFDSNESISNNQIYNQIYGHANQERAENSNNIGIQNDLYVFLMIIIPSISIIIVIVVLTIFGMKVGWGCNNNKNNYTYDRIAYSETSPEDEIVVSKEKLSSKYQILPEYVKTDESSQNLILADPSDSD